ncbi:MAG: cytochrome c oxidase subunit [Miltoncostaeaceae bacterium]|nr:cytochrome c oxidase subunit [Miltoncostaeaceae bacterium]
MRRRKASIAVISVVFALGALAGCVESDPQAAETPTNATTVMNSALQTDSKGNTITAPAETPSEGGGSETPPAGPDKGGAGGAAGDAAAGVQVFNATGCGSCHTLAAANASGMVGPNLDEALAGQSPEEIKTDIVDPEAKITEGFPPGVMPGNYGTSLSDEDLTNLVAALTS